MADQRPELPWLVADIGGTNARFGWVEAPDAGVARVLTFPVAEFATPGDAVAAYLDLVRAEWGSAERPRNAAFAVATPVAGDEVFFTNSHWRFSRTELQAQQRLDRLITLNDFEALALSLPALRADQLRPIGVSLKGGAVDPDVRAVLGPGTGLGVGAVVRTRAGWCPIPGEGGHSTLAAVDAFEDGLLQQVRAQFGHVSAERLLSGVGLPALYRAVAQQLGAMPEALDAPAVIQRALDGDTADPVCSRTVDAFCAFLGGFAGNVALMFGARGGVYIGGGLVPRLGERLFSSAFRDRFENKGRFRSYLQAIPTLLITDTHAALVGAALAIEQAGPRQAAACAAGGS
jgi:glucokinase